jgi:DNA modification methylase
MTYEVHNADCLDHMRTMADNAVDAVVTDPPYGLTFMGKDWDKGVPGEVFWREALRVAKPGAHLLASGGTRKFHRLTCAIEDAGWEIRDCIMWVYGSGFPKSLDVSKAIDKAAGAERECTREPGRILKRGAAMDSIASTERARFDTPATDLARQWQGWGTCLKPAFEPIILARKPLDGTVASTVAKWGTGGLNVDGCRVEITERLPEYRTKGGNHDSPVAFGWNGEREIPEGERAQSSVRHRASGRFPANLVHDGSEEVLAGFPDIHGAGGPRDAKGLCGVSGNLFKMAGGDGHRFGDSGSAARFFYCAKASRGEREAGLREAHAAMRNDGRVTEIDNPYQRGKVLKNHHPTVKPISLMRWLVRLVTPPDGLVLDPFTGSGTTGCAAVLEGKRFIGCELSAEYADIARDRIAHHAAQGVLELEVAP